jgi:histidyl-tRNA synthetase
MSSRPSIPKGTRDFSAADLLKREYIFDTIKKVFRLYGYQPIETPAMENLTTLLGKYGDEGDKLLFRILNSGDFLSGTSDEELDRRDTTMLSSRLCEKGLRYDLTVPFARYVVQHRDEIIFPFRRYQIQPVWRADRPQKGRYREFYQCDVDIIGSNSLLNEAELIQIIDEVFRRLRIGIKIKINNRKILAGIAEYGRVPDRITDITVALDKYEKIGWDQVRQELVNKGIKDDVVSNFGTIISIFDKNNNQKIDYLKEVLSGSPSGREGLDELSQLLEILENASIESEVVFDLMLARGLNYYTGAIIEVKSADVSIGSICGGGRYDDLAGVFGMEGVSGVGVSFGADRIYDVLNALDQFEGTPALSTFVMVLNFGKTETDYAMNILSSLRNMDINAEMYPDQVKLRKQMAYADSKKIPFIIIAGEEEVRNNSITVKNMSSGNQVTIPVKGLETFMMENIRKSGKSGI